MSDSFVELEAFLDNFSNRIIDPIVVQLKDAQAHSRAVQNTLLEYGVGCAAYLWVVANVDFSDAVWQVVENPFGCFGVQLSTV